YGINHRLIESAQLASIEPDLKQTLAGAIHWTDPWTIRNPGALVSGYFELFKSMGGTFVSGDVKSLDQSGDDWSVKAGEKTITAREAVVALGPWAPEVLE